MSVVYIVIKTEFVDDYKARGEDWSNTVVYAFSSMQNAESFVREQEKKYCEEQMKEMTNEEKESIDWADLFEQLTEGEHVPRTLLYEIDEQFIDAAKPNHVVESPKEKRHKK